MKEIAAGAMEEYLEKQNALNKDYLYFIFNKDNMIQGSYSSIIIKIRGRVKSREKKSSLHCPILGSDLSGEEMYEYYSRQSRKVRINRIIIKRNHNIRRKK